MTDLLNDYINVQMVNGLVSAFHRDNSVCLQFLLECSAVHANGHIFNHLPSIALVGGGSRTLVVQTGVFGPFAAIAEESIEIILMFLPCIAVEAQRFEVGYTVAAGTHAVKNHFLHSLALAIGECDGCVTLLGAA